MTKTVSEYVASLGQLTEHCNYGDNLNTMLRDRLVCGINDTRIQKRLLSEGSALTYARALNSRCRWKLQKGTARQCRI